MAALLNGRLENGMFSSPWKNTGLTLIKKEGKDPSQSNAYSSLCIIDAAAKLFEYILKDRIQAQIALEVYATNQHGFRKGRCTLNALDAVNRAAETAIMEQQYAVFINLDIMNAFNSLKWSDIMAELKRQKLPRYLQRILRGYFKGRKIGYRSGDKVKWCASQEVFLKGRF